MAASIQEKIKRMITLQYMVGNGKNAVFTSQECEAMEQIMRESDSMRKKLESNNYHLNEVRINYEQEKKNMHSMFRNLIKELKSQYLQRLDTNKKNQQNYEQKIRSQSQDIIQYQNQLKIV